MTRRQIIEEIKQMDAADRRNSPRAIGRQQNKKPEVAASREMGEKRLAKGQYKETISQKSWPSRQDERENRARLKER
jgi:hypothetical protein